MGASNFIHLEGVKVIAVAEKALLIRLKKNEYWLPKTQVADAEDYEEGDEDCGMSITDWIANEKGISE